jgi:hypothetical protein
MKTLAKNKEFCCKFKNVRRLTHISANEKLKSVEDFKEQCRRQLERSVEERIKYGFFRQYKPILDDEPFRVFEKMEDYRKWMDENLPRYLGYKLVKKEDKK